jgi:hypothetical protein
MDVLVVGGIQRTMDYWHCISKLHNYRIKYNSSNILDNYGRNKFGDFAKLGKRVKNKYDAIIFEFCPLENIIYGSCGNIKKFGNQIEYITKKNNSIIIPAPVNKIDFCNFKNGFFHLKKHDQFYSDYAIDICNEMIKRDYTVYYSPNWTEIDTHLFPDICSNFNRFTIEDSFVDYMVISNLELEMEKFEDTPYVSKK